VYSEAFGLNRSIIIDLFYSLFWTVLCEQNFNGEDRHLRFHYNYLSFVFPRGAKVLHVWNNMSESTFFGRTISLNQWA